MSSENDIDQEIIDFESQYPEFERYEICDKIGEGTFSSVYIARDLDHQKYVNDWCIDHSCDCKGLVALKRIYCTSSPSRIFEELATLKALGTHPNIASLITVLRSQDQIVAVLPYFEHDQYRDYFLDLSRVEIGQYLSNLLGFIHRDVKPSNFLYNRAKGKGVLVDFGLAQQEEEYKEKITKKVQKQSRSKPGFIPNDTRPSYRATRAGTRGFRAPEVLLKVKNQTRKLDVWSVGVILLCILTGVFPFFQSNDDQEALIEIAIIFGSNRMKSLSNALRIYC